MKNLFKITMITFFTVILFLILDIIFYNYFFKKNNNIYTFDYKKFNKYYSATELNRDEVFRHEYHGNNCVKHGNFKKIKGVNWNEKFGPQDKNYDIECILELFSSNKKNILFFGGSAMDNIETPNYLTSIEYYLFRENLEKYRSINFSEGGATLSNNLSQLIEIFQEFDDRSSSNSLNIKIDSIIFLQGYNDFLSIVHGGDPIDSFYWTTVIDNKIHNAAVYYFDKFLRNTYFSRMISNYIFNDTKLAVKLSSLKTIDKINSLDRRIELAAENFIFRKKLILSLCEIYNIKCHIFLQPTFWNSKNLTGQRINIIENYFNKKDFLHQYIYKKGYEIISKDKDIISLTNIFNNKKDIYIDDVHFDKYGSKIIAEHFKKNLYFE